MEHQACQIIGFDTSTSIPSKLNFADARALRDGRTNEFMQKASEDELDQCVPDGEPW